MNKGYRLFERIERGEPLSSHEKVVSHQHLIESIYEHLSDLLNTHIGSAMIDNEYGLPDFNDVLATHSNLIPYIQKNIQETITRFEPRLKNIHVFHNPNTLHHLQKNALELSFGIQAEVIHNGEKVPLSIPVYMRTDGQFNI